MNLFGALALSALAMVTVNLSCTSTPTENRMPAGSRNAAKELADNEVYSVSSSGPLKIESPRIIIDNDAAFHAKLDAIDAAKSGDTIRMVYYIYSDDHSASLFTSKVLEAAKRGVKVQLMLDFIDNYKYLDLFSFMESESNGNIEVRLYGRPTPLVVRDAYYMTIPCPPLTKAPTATECATAKWKHINQRLASNKDAYALADTFTSIFLAGLYNKAATPAKLALTLGGQVDPSATPKPTPEQQEQLKKLTRLVYYAKVKKAPSAYLQLGLAMTLYGDELNPILDQLYGHLPFDQMGNTSSQDDWTHITDYTHHKLLLVENKSRGSFFIQLGGRNIEDSYHMKMNKFSKKYTFMDTDFAANITGGGSKVAAAFDKMWNFKTMTASLSEIRTLMDNEFIANTEAFPEVAGTCMVMKNKTVADRALIAACLTNTLHKSAKFMNLKQRMAKQKENMEKMRDIYLAEYTPNFNESWRSSRSYRPVSSYKDSVTYETENKTNADIEASQLLVSFIENLHFDPKATTPVRQFGVTDGAELKGGKEIHHLILKGLENTCALAKKEDRPKRVIFHSAYWLPPANVIRAFKKMMDGTWDCGNVKVTILTNSSDTTDLKPINVIARYQLKAILETYTHERRKKESAEFEYFEYKRPKGAKDEQIHSLHTKLTLLGDDMIVGSANMDARSYMMDTNDAVFIRNAEYLVGQYGQWIDTITSDATLSTNLTQYYGNNLKLQTLHDQDNDLIDEMKAKKKFGMGKVSAEKIAQLKGWTKDLGEDSYEMTRKLISDVPYTGAAFEAYVPEDMRSIMEKERTEISDKFNDLFQIL